MKSVLRGAIAALMLFGLVSAAALPKTSNNNNNANVSVASTGPAPLCYPTEPNCKPPIPN